MIKKLMMLCVAAMAAIGAWAATWTDSKTGYTWTYSVKGSGVKIYNYGSAAVSPKPTSSITIPSEIGGYQVVEIGAGAFYNCSSLTDVIIPSTVTSVGASAFYGCGALKSVIIPASVTSIGTSAFQGCGALEGVTIPVSVQSIGYRAFRNCIGLKSVSIPVSISKIEDETFYGCISLAEVNLPVTVKTIDSYAFYGCSALKTLNIPYGIEEIFDNAFYGCGSLPAVTFPASLKTIGSCSFYGCSSLTTVDIPSNVNSVGYDAFGACGNLRNVSMPGTLSSSYVFGDSCKTVTNLTIVDSSSSSMPYISDFPALTTLSLPASLERIYNSDISHCSSLTTISVAAGNPYYKVSGGLLLTKDGSEIVAVPKGRTWVDIPDSVTSIPSGIFSGCQHLYAEHSIPGLRIVDGWVVGCDWDYEEGPRPPSILNLTGVCGIADDAFYGCEGLKNVIIGEGVRTIGSFAFDDCHDLESISISSSVRTIGEYAFDDCFRLKSITVASGNAAYEFTGGLLISKDKTQLVAVSREVSTVKIPEGVREIPDDFFGGCNKLTSVSIPSSIDEDGIGDDGPVFSCWYERYDEVTDEWHEETIGCPNLKTITVASGNPYYKSIGGMLCSVDDDEMYLEAVPQALTSVTIPEEVTDVYSTAFEGCAKLKAIKVASGNRYYKSVNGLLLTKDGKELVWVPNALTSVMIPDGVVDLGRAFDGCEKLTSVKIPNSVVAVGRYTFSECPESLFDKKTIPGCRMVDGWIVGVTDEAYERYGKNGEEWNLDLTKARGIAESAFYRGYFGCDATGIISGLHSIVIPKNIIAVGDRAFYGCGNLSSVTIESGVRHIAARAFDECHESLYDDTTLPGFRLVDGWLIDRKYYHDDSIKSLDLTGLRGVAGLKDRRWLFWEGVTNLVVGNGVTAISHGAFANSQELEEVEIADSVTFIGENAFLYCRNLKRVKMPDSLRGKVPTSAFSGCSPNLRIEYYKSILTVEFDANYPPFSNHDGVENVIESRCVESGETIGALPTSVLSKYKFLGWYTAPEGGTKISATTKVTGNVTYYAQWVYDGSATVSAVVAEGCEAMGKVTDGKTANAGTKLTLKATANKGYVFAGWDGPIDDSQDPRNPSLSYVVGEDDAEFVAYFIPVEDDWVDVWMDCSNEYVTNEEISDIYIGADSGSLATLKVAGLPTGLKYTAKPVYDRNGELLHEANTIYGTPTKSGVYTVTVTATTAGKKTDICSAVIVVRKDGERIVKITVPTWYDGETDTDVIPGKVTGAGIYTEGKKVTLKATANKGFVFAGWRDVNSGDWLYGAEDYRSPSLSYIMTDSDMEIEAVFESVEYDDTLVAYVDGNEITSNATDNNFVAEGTTILPLEIESISIPKAAVLGLPAGMKYTDKALTVKATKTEEAYDVPANAIYGTPTKPGLYTVTVKLTNTTIKKAIEKKFTIEVPNFTAANGYFVDNLCNDVGEKYTLSVGITNIDEFLPSLALNSGTTKLAVSGLPTGLKYDAKTGKITGIATRPGTYTVTLTVTDGKAKYVSTITIEVEALPEILVGTYTGLIGRDVNVEKEDPWMAYGMANVMVAANGKITAKMTLPCGTYSFSAAGWDYVEGGVYSAVLQTKNGDEFELVIDSKRDWKEIAEYSALRVNGYKEFRVPIWRNEHAKGGNIESDPVANELISEIKALKKVAFKVEGSKSSGYEVTEVASNDRSANLTVTFDTKGGVKYAGNIDGVRVSGSTFLCIDDDGYYTICDIVVPVGKTESVYIAFCIERDEDGELQFEVDVAWDEFQENNRD